MRPIKFRAWDNQAKEMITDANSGVKIYLNGAYAYKDQYADDGWLELMQYTGLDDKNGVECYECDVVRVEPNSGQFVEFIIEWSDEFACFTFPVRGEAGRPTILPFEVIGNIYAHPELATSNLDRDGE